MSKNKKGAAKKVAPKLIAKKDFYTVINGMKCRGVVGEEIKISDNAIIQSLTDKGFVE